MIGLTWYKHLQPDDVRCIVKWFIPWTVSESLSYSMLPPTLDILRVLCFYLCITISCTVLITSVLFICLFTILISSSENRLFIFIVCFSVDYPLPTEEYSSIVKSWVLHIFICKHVKLVNYVIQILFTLSRCQLI